MHCRAYIESSQGQAGWLRLLQGHDLKQLISQSAAGGAGAAPQAEALCALLEGGEALLQLESEARTRADQRRLRWLAADYDATAALRHAAGAAAGLPAPLQLGALTQHKWMSGQRRLGLMTLLAHSLQHVVARPLVEEALRALLCDGGGELPAELVAPLYRLPPCLRAALLSLLSRRTRHGRFKGAPTLSDGSAPSAPPASLEAPAAPRQPRAAPRRPGCPRSLGEPAEEGG